MSIAHGIWPAMTADALCDMRRAFHAQCTMIDHQMRLVIGTLREQDLLDETIVVFTRDHGDMLGDHGLFAKRVMLAPSVPMLLMGVKDCSRVVPGTRDPRLVGMKDIMPTLLDLAALPCPDTCTGRSLIHAPRARTLYCEALEGAMTMRMVTDGRWKLIWYPAGNRFQLFDGDTDPLERRDLSNDPGADEVKQKLTSVLRTELYGGDLEWVDGDALVGFDAPPLPPQVNRDLSGQRGIHSPEPPRTDPGTIIGAPR